MIVALIHYIIKITITIQTTVFPPSNAEIRCVCTFF